MTQPIVRQPIPVGKFFLDRGKITEHQLELALRHRAEFGLKLGQSLVELGFVTEGDMVEALRYQSRFPCVHLTSGIVDARIAHKVGEPVSRRLRALALNQIAGHTTVALEDPSDERALEELQHLLATRIFAVYAQPSTIRKLIDQVFGNKSARMGATRIGPTTARTRPEEPAPVPPAPAPAAEAPSAAHAAPREAPRETPRETPREIKEPREAPAADAPEERAVVERVRGLLQLAFEQEVSDIHLETRRDELLVRVRIDGALREHSRLPASWSRPMLACLKALAKLPEGAEKQPLLGVIPFVFKKRRFEVDVATTPSTHGECAVLHVRDGERSHLGYAELGLGDEQRAELGPILAAASGLCLVGGTAGSGRATTLHALLEKLATREKKVVVLDEREAHGLDGVLHVPLDRRDGLDYASGTQALLRQDPDVLVVGEIDGRETARCLVQAALNGKYALSSLRAIDALDVLTRLLRLGLEPYLLAESLRGVLAQRVVRQVCPACKAPTVPDEVLRTRLGLAKDGAVYHEGEGCSACQGTGYRGRLRLFEVLALTPGLRRELEKGSGPEALARAAHAEGFRSLRASGLEQARAGRTTLNEILSATGGV